MIFAAFPAARHLRRLAIVSGLCLVMGCAFALLGTDFPEHVRQAPAGARHATQVDPDMRAARDDLLLPAQASATATPLIRVRDSVSGRALEARLTLRSIDDASLVRSGALPASGRRMAPLASGHYAFAAMAAGYAPLAMPLQADGRNAGLPVTFWLTPERPSLALDRLALKAIECGACSVASGHVFDAQSGRPLTGLLVRSDQGIRATTDDQGGFELLLHTSQDTIADTEALPQTTALTFEGQGYRQRIDGVALLNDATHLIVDVARGAGVAQDWSHVQMQARARDQLRAQPAQSAIAAALEAERVSADRDKAIDPARPETSRLAEALANSTASIPVPGSIRVGTDCSARSCGGVSVYAFEDYVGRGLDDEWIASWRPASLAAGAIAYRTYGAYYVAHPVSGRYDICSSTSCQVFRPASVSATVAAAAATRGVMLTRDGQTAAFSEYSAENNAWDDPGDGLSCSNPDLSCGNGRNGSPRNQWPCLSDSVGSGRGCFGHGRGMSQWGTQRWAANHGRDWAWITNHYFNANNSPGGMRNAFLANLPSGGQITLLDNFEAGVGHFRSIPTYSGSTAGIAVSSFAQRSCGIRHGGACSLQVQLVDDPASSSAWSVRLLSALGDPAGNAALARTGRVGFWVYAGGTGMSVGVGIDDSDGTERSVSRTLPANSWTYVEWSMADAAQWNAWAGGANGTITASSVKLDAVWFYRAQTSYTVNLYVDDVQIRN